ncbi:glycoside hydrolase family 5 protein [Candidatus Bathyarchaeota archaeon]|nr:glycoside hydrolase family 5 protein [Candidatus Bathyarchaeota archaeon]
MRRGVNIGNALEAPNEGEWGVYIEDEYFRIIKEAGFDTVRIPIKWSGHAETSPPYKIDENFLQRVEWVVNRSLEQNLVTIINIQHYDEIMQNPNEHKNRFLGLWRQISENFKDYPENLFFELLNEPHGNLLDDVWNEFIEEAVKIIRETNPTRKIIVGPTGWNSVYNLEGLTIPAEDKNIIVTFHFYTPFEFTHQGAEWVDPSPPVGRKWVGDETEQSQITNELDIAVQWAMQHGNITLFLGEFGAYSKADMNSRVMWTYFVARESEKRDISWCYWEFCAGFGAYDPENEVWRMDLLNALIPQAMKYYVSVDSELGEAYGSGWYDEGTYAMVGVEDTASGLIIQDILDHFEGLGPADIAIDAKTVRIFVDGPRQIVAVWRKDYTRLILFIVITLLVTCSAILIYNKHGEDRTSKFSRYQKK